MEENSTGTPNPPISMTHTVSSKINAIPVQDTDGNAVDFAVNLEAECPNPVEEKESIEQKKQRVPRKRTSDVWNYYEDYFDDTEKCQKAKCNFCGKILKANFRNNGTSSLRQHTLKCPMKLSNNHPLLNFRNIVCNEVTGEKKGSLFAWRFDQALTRKALASMIILDELPFRFVEGEGFKKFVNVACPSFAVPCRKTATTDCYSLYLEEKDKLRRLLKPSTNRICFTIDTWTSVQKINYMCLTAHFIDTQWRLQKRVLNFCPISSHNGSDIGEAVVKCCQEWGIGNVFTITVDNATTNDKTISYLIMKIKSWSRAILGGQWCHMRFMAHIMHLIVKEGLDELSNEIECIRAVVKYIRSSPSRLKSFKEVCLLEGLEYKKQLCLDVPTRWNSTYLMLSTALEYTKVFENYCESNSQLKDTLDLSFGPGITDDATWENARYLTNFLEGFYDHTK